jgi:hypothetical protein
MAVFRSWRFISHSWESISLKISQSELAHVVKSGLRSCHAISDPRPIHRTLNVLLRCSRTWGAQCAGAPSCFRMHVDSRPLWRSCETNYVWRMFRYAVWLTFPSKMHGSIKWSVEIAAYIILLGTCEGTLWLVCTWRGVLLAKLIVASSS